MIEQQVDNFINIKIVGGLFKGYSALLDKDKNEIRDFKTDKIAITDKILKLSDIAEISEVIQYADNAKIAGIVVSSVALILFIPFTVYFFVAFIPAVLFGGIAWSIAKQNRLFIKKTGSVIRLKTIQNEILEIQNRPLIHTYLFSKKSV